MTSTSNLLDLWSRAAESEIGIAVQTNDPKALRTKLLNTVREADHPQKDQLITFLPEGKDEVFICRKTVELPA